MIIKTNLRAFGRPVYRDSKTGRFASRAAWLDQRVAQELAEQQRAEAVAPGRATRYRAHQVGGRPGRFPALETPAQTAWKQRNVEPWRT